MILFTPLALKTRLGSQDVATKPCAILAVDSIISIYRVDYAEPVRLTLLKSGLKKSKNMQNNQQRLLKIIISYGLRITAIHGIEMTCNSLNVNKL